MLLAKPSNHTLSPSLCGSCLKEGPNSCALHIVEALRTSIIMVPYDSCSHSVTYLEYTPHDTGTSVGPCIGIYIYIYIYIYCIYWT